jgi:hypothetical protein
MPVSRRSFLPGNFIELPDFTLGEVCDMLIPGFSTFVYRGFARVTTATGNQLNIGNRADLPPLIPASPTNPAYIYQVAFSIPPFSSNYPNEYGSNLITTSVAGDVLKFAPTAASDATSTTVAAATTAPAATVQGVANAFAPGEYTSIIAPNAPIVLTADTTFSLFSSTAAGAAGAASGNIRTAQGWFWIPVRIAGCRRMSAPSMSDVQFSESQMRINADA